MLWRAPRRRYSLPAPHHATGRRAVERQRQSNEPPPLLRPRPLSKPRAKPSANPPKTSLRRKRKFAARTTEYLHEILTPRPRQPGFVALAETAARGRRSQISALRLAGVATSARPWRGSRRRRSDAQHRRRRRVEHRPRRRVNNRRGWGRRRYVHRDDLPGRDDRGDLHDRLALAEDHVLVGWTGRRPHGCLFA